MVKSAFIGTLVVLSTSAFALPGHITKPIPISNTTNSEIGVGVVVSDPGGSLILNDMKPVADPGGGVVCAADEQCIRVNENTGAVEILVQEDIQHGQPAWMAAEAVSYQDQRLTDAVNYDDWKVGLGPVADVGTYHGPGDFILKKDPGHNTAPVDRVQYYGQGYGMQHGNPCGQGFRYDPCANPCLQTINPCMGMGQVAPYYQVPAQPYVFAHPRPRIHPRAYAQPHPHPHPHMYGGDPRAAFVRPHGGYYARPHNVYRYPRVIRRW